MADFIRTLGLGDHQPTTGEQLYAPKGKWWTINVRSRVLGYTYCIWNNTCGHSGNAPIIVMPHLPQVGHGWGLLGICKSRLTDSPPLGTILCYKSPTFCMGIPKTMKIYGQMPQPWGQIMLTNRYKSPPVARPGVGGGWQW